MAATALETTTKVASASVAAISFSGLALIYAAPLKKPRAVSQRLEIPAVP
jgi:hypothetical protein